MKKGGKKGTRLTLIEHNEKKCPAEEKRGRKLARRAKKRNNITREFGNPPRKGEESLAGLQGLGKGKKE